MLLHWRLPCLRLTWIRRGACVEFYTPLSGCHQPLFPRSLASHCIPAADAICEDLVRNVMSFYWPRCSDLSAHPPVQLSLRKLGLDPQHTTCAQVRFRRRRRDRQGREAAHGAQFQVPARRQRAQDHHATAGRARVRDGRLTRGAVRGPGAGHFAALASNRPKGALAPSPLPRCRTVRCMLSAWYWVSMQGTAQHHSLVQVAAVLAA